MEVTKVNGQDSMEIHDLHGPIRMHTDSFALHLDCGNVQIIDEAGQPVTLLNSHVAKTRISFSRDFIGELLLHLQAFADSGTLDPQQDSTKHPQWPKWYKWYTEHYTSHVPMYKGEPANSDTALSWNTWLAMAQEKEQA